MSDTAGGAPQEDRGGLQDEAKASRRRSKTAKKGGRAVQAQSQDAALVSVGEVISDLRGPAADSRPAQDTERELAAHAGERVAPVPLAQAEQAIDSAIPTRLGAVRERGSDGANGAPGGTPDETIAGEKFVVDLDSRLAKSELAELGWRNRTDLDDVMRDMERLAALDWQRAADLWSKYRPNDIHKPSFLDVSEADKKPEVRNSVAGEPSREASKEEEPATHDSQAAGFLAPESIRKRFLADKNRYFFREEGHKLAFEDIGKRLVTEHNHPEVAGAMVDLAGAKGWTTVRVKGTEEFKREVWVRASLKGLEVEGFQPRDVDRARLADAREEQARLVASGLNSIYRVPDRHRTAAGRNLDRAQASGQMVVDEHQRTLTGPQRAAVETIKAIMRSRGDSQKAVAMAADIAAERFQNNRVYVGKITEHGPAPFEHDPKNEKSYYVKLDTRSGEKVLWGVDLARAVTVSRTRVGDDVVLAYQGKQAVTVQVKERDAAGAVIGEKPVTTHRNTWDIRNLDSLRAQSRERLAAAAQSADKQPVVNVYDRDAPRTDKRPEVNRDRGRDAERVRT